MKKQLCLLVLCMFSAVFAADEVVMKSKLPDYAGESGPKILLFSGGRPWQGNDVRNILVRSGAKVRGIVGTYLAGLSGASIKQHMSDKVEPTPFDGITPAFKQLNNFKLVMFNFIPEENLLKLFTPERQERLKAYVENGGHVIFTLKTPVGLMPELMPIEQSGDYIQTNDQMFANRPEGKKFDFLPEKLPVFGKCREAVAKEDAQVLSMIKDEAGNDVSPYLVRRQIGKGSVSFLNTEHTTPSQMRQFANWAYANAFFAAVVAECGNLNTKPLKCLINYDKIPKRKILDCVSLDIAEPVLEISGDTRDAVIDGKSVAFAGGVKLLVNDDGSVNLTFPNQDKPFIRNFKIPAAAFSEIKLATKNLSYEADDMTTVVKAADIKWKFDHISQQNGIVSLHYTAPESDLEWQFKAGKMDLDGRSYCGVAERVFLSKCPLFINQFSFESELDLPEPLYARRFDAYSPPRGYTEFPMDGKEKRSDTHTWSFIGSGQPFELIACKNGVYLSGIEEAKPTKVQLIRNRGDKYIASKRINDVGQVKAPVETGFQWHWFSEGAERGNHEYLAMYQFVRQMLRRQNGLRELPAYPVVWYSYQLSATEKETLLEKAVKAGFRFIYRVSPESSINSINRESNLEKYRDISSRGVGVMIWTAGSYTQGKNGWIFKNHPEWFCKKANGDVFTYPGNYPVIDLHNEEFYNWYCEVLKDAISAGVKWVYRDMDGAAASVINHALEQSPEATKEQIKFYKFFHDNDCRVSIEGANPLVIDQYWYRPDKYTSFAGKEFALVGGVPYGDNRGGLMLDFFRTGMYGTFVAFEYAGTALDFDRFVGEAERGRRASSLAPKFNEALDFVGMPYVRESEFGTVWYGKGGAVMFFWDPVKKLTLNLPQGWKIRGVEGNTLTDIPGDSIIYIDRP